jgi:hypothetical protein
LYQEGENHKDLYTRTLKHNKELIRKVHDLRQDAREVKEAYKRRAQEGEKTKKEESTEEPFKLEEVSSKELTLQEIPKLNNADIEKLESHVKTLEQLLVVQAERIKHLEDMLDKSEKIELRPKSRQELPPMDNDL